MVHYYNYKNKNIVMKIRNFKQEKIKSIANCLKRMNLINAKSKNLT